MEMVDGWRRPLPPSIRVLYDKSATWQVCVAIFLSSLSQFLVSGHSFSSKAKGDNPDRNNSICGQLQRWLRCINMVAVPARLLRQPQSTCLNTLCLATPISVVREIGVCDTTILHVNPLVVWVIIDGCQRAHIGWR